MGISFALRHPPEPPALCAPLPIEELAAETINLRVIFERIGPLVDGTESSRRFRTLIVSDRLSGPQLAELMREAIESPLERQARRALQDLINAGGQRLGLGVRFGAYDPAARGPLRGDGLWQITSDLVALVVVVPQAAEFEPPRIAADLLSLPADFPTLKDAELMLLAVSPAAQARILSSRLGRRPLARRSRVLEIESLMELLRMRDAGALSTPQAAVLLGPLDGRRVSRTLDAMERFVVAAGDESLPWSPRVATEAPHQANGHGLQDTFIPGRSPLPSPALPPPPAPPSPRAMGLPRQSTPGQAALIRAYRAHRAGDRAGAIGGLRFYLASNPVNLKAWELLGDLLEADGRTDEAVETYRQGLSSLPRRDGLLTKLTSTLARKAGLAGAQTVAGATAGSIGPLDAHLALAVTFARLEPTASRFHAHKAMDELRLAYAKVVEVLADTAMALGDRDEAIHVMERALTLLGEDAPLKERLAVLEGGRRRRFRLLGF